MNKDMQLIRASELAAICTYHQIGKKDKMKVDEWAVVAMREILNQAEFKAEIIVGEGELDEAPMLYAGEILGKGISGVEFDIAVDPVESTNGCASGKSFSGTVLAASRKGTMRKVPEMYMNKFFVAAEHAKHFDNYKFVSLEEAVTHLQKCLGRKNIVGICLDRKRNQHKVDYIKENGGIVKLITDGDVLAAIDVVNGCADFVFGSGGSPEGAAMAALANASGGVFYCRFQRYDELFPEEEGAVARSEMEVKALEELGLDIGAIYNQKELCNDDKARFVCTAITSSVGSSLIPIEKDDDYFRVSTIFVSHGITRRMNADYKIALVKEMIPVVGDILEKIGVDNG